MSDQIGVGGRPRRAVHNRWVAEYRSPPPWVSVPRVVMQRVLVMSLRAAQGAGQPGQGSRGGQPDPDRGGGEGGDGGGGGSSIADEASFSLLPCDDAAEAVMLERVPLLPRPPPPNHCFLETWTDHGEHTRSGAIHRQLAGLA